MKKLFIGIVVLFTIQIITSIVHRIQLNKQAAQYEIKIDDLIHEFAARDSIQRIIQLQEKEIDFLYTIIDSVDNKRNDETEKYIAKADSIRNLSDSAKISYLARKYNLFTR